VGFWHGGQARTGSARYASPLKNRCGVGGMQNRRRHPAGLASDVSRSPHIAG